MIPKPYQHIITKMKELALLSRNHAHVRAIGDIADEIWTEKSERHMMIDERVKLWKATGGAGEAQDAVRGAYARVAREAPG